MQVVPITESWMLVSITEAYTGDILVIIFTYFFNIGCIWMDDYSSLFIRTCVNAQGKSYLEA